MKYKELKIAGALIYACEGTKVRMQIRNNRKRYIYAIEFTNSNPQLISLFMRFLNEILKIDPAKLRVQLFLYPDHDRKKLLQFWSEKSKIPLTQFQQVISLTQKNSKYKPNPLGTCKIRYNGKKDFLRLQKITDEVWRDAGVV